MAFWVPIMLAVAGAAAQAMGEDRARSGRNRLEDALRVYRSGKAAEGRTAIEGYTAGLTPEARAAESTAVQDEIRRGMETAVGEAKGYETRQPFAGQASRRFVAAREAGQARNAERLSRAVNQLSVIGAPRERDLRQSVRYGTASTDVDAANVAANNVMKAYLLAMGNVRPPAYLQYGGQVLGGLGASGFGGG